MLRMAELALENAVQNDLVLRLTYMEDVDGINRISLEQEEKIKEIDKRISCGAFATFALLIEKRLFIINIGMLRGRAQCN